MFAYVTPAVLRKVDNLATRLEAKGYIGKHQKRYLVPSKPNAGTLQGNPKLHKAGASMRTVVSGKGHATERMAELAERQLKDVHEDSNVFVFVFKYVFESALIWSKFTHNHGSTTNNQNAKIYAPVHKGLVTRGQNKVKNVKNWVPHKFFSNSHRKTI